jgi:hypothetical protein
MVLLPLLAALAIDSFMPLHGSACESTGTKPAGAAACTFFGNVVDHISPSFTNTAGTLLVCGATQDQSSSGPTTNTYNSVAMTRIVASTASAAAGYSSLFFLKTPATGANTLTFTWTGVTNGDIYASCLSFTGNDTVNPIFQGGQSSTNDANISHSVTLSGSAPGNYAMDMSCTGSGFSSSDTTWESGDNFAGSTACNNGSSSYISVTGTSTSMGYTLTGADVHNISVAEIAAAAGGAATPMRTLMGVGQ